MFLWSAQPLNKELLAISDAALSQRQPAVESQYDTIQLAFVEHLRKLARQFPSIITHTVRIDDIFGENLYAPNAKDIKFTPTGLSFQTAMNGIEPPYPTPKEKNWICTRIVGYLSSQGLISKYGYEAVDVAWRPVVDDI